jgi:branched-chain amino acid transport system substrate-binding protein
MSKHDRAAGALIPRRSFLAGAAASLVLPAPAVLAQSTAPVKVGAVLSLSKVFAALGVANINGMTLAFDEVGWRAGGRKIELLKEDDEVNPQVGLQKLRKLVQGEKCDITCGPQASNVAGSFVDFLTQSRGFHLVSGAGTSKLQMTKPPYMFRTSTSGWQHNHPMGEWYYDNVAKEALFIAPDFAGGHDNIEEFKSGFLPKGGRVVKDIWTPLGTSDFSPYLADIRAVNPPAVFAFLPGSDGVRFVKQFAEFGLKGTTVLSGSGFMFDADTLPAQGKDAVGAYSSSSYAAAIDNPENKVFVASYRSHFNEDPSIYSDYGYVTARVIIEILNACGGDTSDKERMKAVLLDLKFNAPRGPVNWDPQTHNVIHNAYIRQVVEDQGAITNRIVATIANVRDPGRRET